MNKKIISAVSAVSAASMLGLGAMAAPAVDGRKTCEAYIADITLDGKIDAAWNYAPSINVDVVKKNASSWYGDTSKVAGVDYATLECKVLWNGADTLYILYVVEDNCISLSGANEWDRDSVEYFIQMDNSTVSSDSKIQKRMFADGTSSVIASSDFGYAETDKGFVYEIAVDISAAGGAGEYIGIDFQYNDDAEGNGVRNVCLGWSDSDDKASSDVSVYGQCKLTDTTVASLIEAEKAKNETSPATADAVSVAALALSAAAAAGFALRRRG